jgi:putative hydrolase of the HAD superfamily
VPATHVLFDFGEVISLRQPAADVVQLADLAGLPVEEFSRRYWAHRSPYDQGGSALTYWTQVVGSTPDAELVRRLTELDTASWMHLDPIVLNALDQLHDRGIPVSLLSNAPAGLARALDDHVALKRFAHRIFSCDLRMAKPHPEVFRATMARLDVAPECIVFLDDRAENVRSAEAAGLRTIHYTGADRLRALASI